MVEHCLKFLASEEKPPERYSRITRLGLGLRCCAELPYKRRKLATAKELILDI